MTVNVNGVELYYEVTGSGDPLILIHGNMEDHTIFDEAVEQLKDSFTCYAVDSRGHGKSTRVDYLDYDIMGEDVVQMLEKLDLRDVTYYGFSDGGNIGLIVAQHTDRLKKMIISGTVTDPSGIAGWLTAVFKFICFFNKSPHIKMMLDEPHISNDDLKRISVPTLVLAGEKDLVLEPHTRNIADNIPNAVLRILPGEGHGSYIVHSTKIAALIKQFVEDPDGLRSGAEASAVGLRRGGRIKKGAVIAAAAAVGIAGLTALHAVCRRR